MLFPSSGFSSKQEARATKSSEEISLLWVIFAALCFFLTMTSTNPIASQVLIENVCLELQGGENCDSSEVSAQTSLVALCVSLASNIPAFLTSGLYGSIADRYGRKTSMIIPLVGFTVYAGAYLFLSIFKPTYYFALIVCASLFLGLTGSISTFQMSIFAHGADLTSHRIQDRAFVFSLLEACLYISKVVGPIESGVWAKEHGYTPPLVFATALCGATVVWVFLMPESLSADSPVRSRPLTLDPFKTFRNLWMLVSIKPKVGLSPLPFLSAAFFFFFAAYMGSMQILVLYVKHQFHWSSDTIGYYEASEGAISMIAMLLFPLFIRWAFGSYVDIWWIAFGYAARGVHFCLFAMAPNTTAIFLLVPILIFCGPLTPRTRAILSNSVPPSQQASILSAFSAVQAMVS